MGLEKILAKIESDAKSEAERIISEAETHSREILDAAREKGKDLESAIIRQSTAVAEEERKRALTLAGLDARRYELEYKQAMIEKSFDEAKSRLAHMPDQEYLSLIKKMLMAAVVTGEEEVTVSPADASRITQVFLDQVNAELFAGGKKGALKIAGAHREMLGGFVLVHGKIETNHSFDVALRLMRDELEPEVIDVLYGGATGSQG